MKKPYIYTMNTPHRPRVTLLMAQSLDGKIAIDSDHFPDWTAKGDKKFFAEKTKEAGVMVMGRTTYDTIGRPLPGRKTVVMTRNTQLVSDHLDLLYTQDSPAQILQTLQQEGFKDVILAGGTTINTLWAKHGMIDRVLLTVSPVVFGQGLSLFQEHTPMKLKLEAHEIRNDNLVILDYTVIT